MLPSQSRRLYEFLRSMLLDILRHVEESASKQERATREVTQSWEEKQNEVGAAIAVAIKTAADSVPEYEKRQRKKEHNLQWRMFWVTLFGAVAATGAAVGAFYYASIAKAQLDQTSRPWISIDDSNADGVTFAESLKYTSDKRVQISLRYKLQNTGHSPAFAVEYGKLYDYADRPDSQDFTRIIDDEICKGAKTLTRRDAEHNPDPNGSIPWTFVVLPNFPTKLAMFFDDTFEDKSMEFSKKSLNEGKFTAFILGCIAYQAVEQKTVHQTGFSVRISMCNPDGTPPLPGHEIPIEIGEGTIDRSRLCATEVLAVGKAD